MSEEQSQKNAGQMRAYLSQIQQLELSQESVETTGQKNRRAEVHVNVSIDQGQLKTTA